MKVFNSLTTACRDPPRLRTGFDTDYPVFA